jgi:hypothetical protein
MKTVGKLEKAVPNKRNTTYRIMAQGHIGLRLHLIVKDRPIWHIKSRKLK